MIYITIDLPFQDKNGNPTTISRDIACGDLCHLIETGHFNSRQFFASVRVDEAWMVQRAIQIVKDRCYVDHVWVKITADINREF